MVEESGAGGASGVGLLRGREGGSKGSLARKHPADSRGGQGYQRREDPGCSAPFRGTMLPAAWKGGLVPECGSVATRAARESAFLLQEDSAVGGR